MTTLITGVAGFIGSHLAKYYLESGELVVGVDNFSSYYSTELKRRRVFNLSDPNFKFYELDLSVLNNSSWLFKEFNFDKVFHFAAQPGVRLPIKDNHIYTKDNLVAFSNVMQSIIDFEVKEFVYASSSSVYGNSEEFPYSESTKILQPISYYGATKLCNEIIADALVKNSSTKAIGLRFFTVYGPWGRPDMAYLRIINSILNNKPFNLYGSGEVLRDFTFIQDLITSIAFLSKNLSKISSGTSEIFNIGGGSPYSILDLINEVQNQTGKQLEIIYKDKFLTDVQQTLADCTKLENFTGFKPKINLRSGLNEVLNWAFQNEVKSEIDKWVS